MRKVNTVDELIDAFGGPKAFAKAVYPTSPAPTARGGTVRLRKCIPFPRWGATIQRAAERGIEVTHAQLAEWHAAQRGRQYQGRKHGPKRAQRHHPQGRAQD
jgi:hypothetical protein